MSTQLTLLFLYISYPPHCGQFFFCLRSLQLAVCAATSTSTRFPHSTSLSLSQASRPNLDHLLDSNPVFDHSALSPIAFRLALSIVTGLIPALTDIPTTSSPPQNPPAGSLQHLDPKTQTTVLQLEASSQTAQNGRIKGSTLLLLPNPRSLFSPSLTPPLT